MPFAVRIWLFACLLSTAIPLGFSADSTTPALSGQLPDPSTSTPLPAADPFWSWFPAHTLKGQTTAIVYKHPSFPAEYSGSNSLIQHEGSKLSITATLFAGVHLWPGGEIYFNPEVAGGEGPSGVVGVAGAINGETPRVASPDPVLSTARLFVRQTINLGGEKEKVVEDINQIAGERAVNRLVITIGRFAANDLFDVNAYSHDPRTQFSNWSLWENGAWDYPANTRGYTNGIATELTYSPWSLRLAIFQEPSEANGQQLDSHILNAHALTGEIEHRHVVGELPGAVRILTFANSSNAGRYSDSIEQGVSSGSVPDITLVRRYQMKYGFGVNVEQSLSSEFGIFGRIGWNDGHTESWAFTEIDSTASLGMSLHGSAWHRRDDVFGLAAVVNGISSDHRNYLAAGGSGFIIGDGALNYSNEMIAETYYSFQATSAFSLSPSMQYVINPAYNRDRGPVWFWGVRGHADF